MRYTDWVSLMKPRAPEFSDYVNKKIQETEAGYD